MNSPVTLKTLIDENYLYDHLPSIKRKISVHVPEYPTLRFEGPFHEMDGHYMNLVTNCKWFKRWKTAHVLVPISVFDLPKENVIGYPNTHQKVLVYPQIGSVEELPKKELFKGRLLRMAKSTYEPFTKALKKNPALFTSSLLETLAHLYILNVYDDLRNIFVKQEGVYISQYGTMITNREFLKLEWREFIVPHLEDVIERISLLKCKKNMYQRRDYVIRQLKFMQLSFDLVKWDGENSITFHDQRRDDMERMFQSSVRVGDKMAAIYSITELYSLYMVHPEESILHRPVEQVIMYLSPTDISYLHSVCSWMTKKKICIYELYAIVHLLCDAPKTSLVKAAYEVYSTPDLRERYNLPRDFVLLIPETGFEDGFVIENGNRQSEFTILLYTFLYYIKTLNYEAIAVYAHIERHFQEENLVVPIRKLRTCDMAILDIISSFYDLENIKFILNTLWIRKWTIMHLILHILVGRSPTIPMTDRDEEVAILSRKWKESGEELSQFNYTLRQPIGEIQEDIETYNPKLFSLCC